VTRKRWVLAGAVVLVGVGVTGGVVAVSSAQRASATAQEVPVSTATVERGQLSAMVSLAGILTYRARWDGSPYAVINQASGTYTRLPYVGDKVSCGDALYRVDDHPVLLLCGTVPAYRNLHPGDAGHDVRQLNQNLHQLGYDAGKGIDPDDHVFTWKTEKALEALQDDRGFAVTGTLALDEAVFLPDSVRIAKVSSLLGGSAQPGVPLLDATSDTLEVQVALEASQQSEVQQGDRAQITLPGNQSVTGKVDRLGRVAQVPDNDGGQDDNPGDATLTAFITLDDPAKARGLDRAPVRVEIATKGVENVLSVPVTAIVGNSGGGFAVEVVRDDGRRELVAVELGLFDTTAGRVQVEGDLREGDRVAVPSP
jgi:peptidoglycan hydrolase-like protein with peptidoglycan-binding domain